MMMLVSVQVGDRLMMSRFHSCVVVVVTTVMVFVACRYCILMVVSIAIVPKAMVISITKI